VPKAVAALEGVTVIEIRAAGPIVNVVEPLSPSQLAVTVEVPGASLVTRPALPALLLIVATAVFDELQLAEFVISSMEPSL
jgi:hypothetical protein